MAKMSILEYINKATPNHLCPFCGGGKWDFIGERGILIPNEKGEFDASGEIDRAIMTECSGCGFVRWIRPYRMIQEAMEKSEQ